jgi:hypothetical protein
VTKKAVCGDLEVEMLAPTEPLCTLDDAHEDLVLRLRGREGTEVVLTDEQRGSSS